MADGDVDISELTVDQQQALQQFTLVTNQDVQDAVPLLRRCEWNVHVCKSCQLWIPLPYLTNIPDCHCAIL